MTSWDAQQYLKFGDERSRPARELLGRIPLAAAESVVDLGCGPGNSTALLLERWPSAVAVGVDKSPDMLARARLDMPFVQFVEADLADFAPAAPADVIFANAVLQWIPDHDHLLVRQMGFLRPGGVLAFQMPINLDQPSHALMRTLPGPWNERVAGVQGRAERRTAEHYYDLLAPFSSQVDVWQTTYEHVMPDAEAIVEWVRGTGLRPYLDAVGPQSQAAYLSAYTAAIDEAYPRRADGRRLFHFPRLSVVAQRAQ